MCIYSFSFDYSLIKRITKINETVELTKGQDYKVKVNFSIKNTLRPGKHEGVIRF